MPRPRRVARPPAPAPTPVPAVDTRVTVGSNKDVKQVVLIFGDPLSSAPMFYTFEAEQARHVARQLLEHADMAEGRKQ